MTEDPRTGRECPPVPTKPAELPKAPGGTCNPLPTTTPPTIDDPEKTSPCPTPDPKCKCPAQPGSTSSCLDGIDDALIAKIAGGEKAKTSKTENDALKAKAKAAEQEYTTDKYGKLVKTWGEQDVDIADLIRKLVCALPCWRCVVDCYVCSRINALHYAEASLYGDGKTFGSPTTVKNLYDLRYWHERDRDAKRRVLQRIKDVLAVWEKPAQTIERILGENRKLIIDIGQMVGTDAAKAVYDLFFKLVPMHLAIAPPSSSQWKTRIAEEYAQLCGCDKGERDDCCGPDVGLSSLRLRLIGSQPYLIDPADYMKVICCLVEHRLRPAKDAEEAADAAYQKADNDIKRRKSQVDDGLKSFEKDVKAAIPSAIRCCHDDDMQVETPAQTSSAS